MDRCLVAVHTQAEQLPTYLAHIGPARDDLLTDVASFRETEGGFRGHLEGERVLVHVRAESRDACLDPQQLQRVAPDGRDPSTREFLPLIREARVGRPNRVAGCPGRLHAADVRRSIPALGQRQESVSRYSTDFDTEHGTDRRIRVRPEDLEVTGRSEVAELHVIAHTSLLENPKDAVFLRGLDVEDEGIGQRIRVKISEDAALRM